MRHHPGLLQRRSAVGIAQHRAVNSLSDGQALERCLLTPLAGFGFVLFGAFAIHIHLGQFQLGRCVAPFGALAGGLKLRGTAATREQ